MSKAAGGPGATEFMANQALASGHVASADGIVSSIDSITLEEVANVSDCNEKKIKKFICVNITSCQPIKRLSLLLIRNLKNERTIRSELTDASAVLSCALKKRKITPTFTVTYSF